MGEFCLLYLLCMLPFPVPQTLYGTTGAYESCSSCSLATIMRVQRAALTLNIHPDRCRRFARHNKTESNNNIALLLGCCYYCYIATMAD
jgi:hypothetical protein